MDDVMSGRTPRTPRRRWVLWAVFGTVGLIMGAAYATGFASTNNTTAENNAGEATNLNGKPAIANPSLYAGTITNSNALPISFDGNYGTLPSTVMFTIDLSGNDPYGHPYAGTYYSDIVLSNWAALALNTATPQWDILDFKFLGVECDAGFTTWTAASPDGPAAPSAQMDVDTVDAHVTFTGLAGGHKYCFGLDNATSLTEAAVLQAAAGGSVNGTVLFRPNATPGNTVPTAPNFTATVNRSA
jgi:hypothetical protein